MSFVILRLYNANNIQNKESDIFFPVNTVGEEIKNTLQNV